MLRKLLASVAKESSGLIFLLILFIFMTGLLEGASFALFLPVLELFTSSPQESASSAFSTYPIISFFQLNQTGYALEVLMAMMIALFALKNACLYIQRMMAAKVALGYEFSLKKKLISRLLSAKWKYLSKQNSGKLVNAVEHESKQVANSIEMLALLSSEVLSLSVYVVMGFWVSWKVFLMSLCFGAIMVFLLKRLIHLSRSIGTELVETKNQSQSAVLEILGALKFIKGNFLESNRSAQVRERFAKIRDHELRGRFYTAIVDSLPEFIIMTAICLIFLASYRFLGVEGEVLMFLVMILYRMNRRFLSLQTMRQRLAIYIPSFEFCESLLSDSEKNKELPGGLKYTGFNKHIRFDHVSFGYDEKQILENMSFVVNKNQMVALIGKSGSGKTTCLDILLGLLRPSSGKIWIDDCDIARINQFLFRQSIAYLPQEPFVMNATIEANIKLGNELATQEEVENAAKLADAHNFILSQSQGYQTSIGDRGLKLSGGQRQRIALSRALLKNPQLLILDEATSALDNEAQFSVQQAIAGLKGKLTILVVAHRLSTIQAADSIYMMDRGKVVESGRFEELMDKSDVFKSLYHLENKEVVRS